MLKTCLTLNLGGVLLSDGNGQISGPELYGAFQWLGMLHLLDGEDVVDCLEAVDKNRDNCIDYKEFMDEFAEQGNNEDDEEVVVGSGGSGGSGGGSTAAAVVRDVSQEGVQEIPTVAPFGHDEIRTIQLRRLRQNQSRHKEERETYKLQEIERAKQMYVGWERKREESDCWCDCCCDCWCD